jgi:hypothetical protein
VIKKPLTVSIPPSLRTWLRASLAYHITGSEREAIFHYLRDGMMRDHKAGIERKLDDALRLLNERSTPQNGGQS